ncbi:MAG: hypothetical protein GY929_14245 [Actinomycetia bacterium]|nr:hypothetical protein [Actinomycetes bacterium]
MAIDDDRIDALRLAKLGALVRAHFGDPGGNPDSFPGGAVQQAGTAAWILLADDPVGHVGGALLWADRHQVDEVHLLVDDFESIAGSVARRVGPFDVATSTWRVDGASLTPVGAAGFEAPAQPPAAAVQFAPTLAAAGLEIVIEHGVVTGEYLGLEVARVVTDDEGARLEVGVGRHDRFAGRIVYDDMPTDEALATAVAAVSEIRNSGAGLHPLNRIARERWVRAVVTAEPGLLEADRLEPVEPGQPRDSLLERRAAHGLAFDADGRRRLVSCSAGIDLELVVEAADVRQREAPDHDEMILVLPGDARNNVLDRMVGRLRRPARVVTVPPPWTAD